MLEKETDHANLTIQYNKTHSLQMLFLYVMLAILILILTQT